MGANMPAILIHGDAVSGKSHPWHRTSAPLAGTTFLTSANEAFTPLDKSACALLKK